jgi:TolA-binding protein
MEAISELNKFSNTLTTEPIKDDALWLEAKLRLQQGEFDSTLAICQKIVAEFGEDVLADDAYFMEGEIYDRYLNNKDKAMETYREFLNKYPGSVYVAEARKRFRQLRGDFAETPLN